MPLDPGFVGRVYPPSAPYEVGREKIREFADALGDENPAYRDPAAARALGYPDVIAPPTFPIVLTLPATAVLHDPELGIDYSRVVHGEQSFLYTRPIQAGDVLSVTVSVESLRSAAGNDLLTSRSEVTDATGAHVVTALATIVVRGPAE